MYKKTNAGMSPLDKDSHTKAQNSRMWSQIWGTLFFFTFFISSAQPAVPTWAIEHDPTTPVELNLTSGDSAQVTYIVRNLQDHPQTLVMRHLPGVSHTQQQCELPANGTCTLTLTIKGSGLLGDIIGGPVLCEQGTSHCDQPRSEHVLRVHQLPRKEQISINTMDLGNGSITFPEPGLMVNVGSTVVFTATPNEGFNVNDWFEGYTQMQSGGSIFQLNNIRTHQTLTASFGTIDLTPQTPELNLSVVDANGKPHARKIRIENKGTMNAEGLSVREYPSKDFPALPAGTNMTHTCTGNLEPGKACEITITPGNTASSDGTQPCNMPPGSTPRASKIQIYATNMNFPTEVSVRILGYGCVHEGGYVFSIDDTTPDTESIKGKVVSLLDEPLPKVEGTPEPSTNELPASGTFGWQWQSSQSGSASQPTLSQNSNPTEPTNTLDGLKNTQSLAEPAGQYPAAQLCLNKAELGYVDWYLPAICELGVDVADMRAGCNNPSISNLYTTLFLKNIGGLSNRYWSSTALSPEWVWTYAYRHNDQPQEGGRYNDHWDNQPFLMYQIKQMSYLVRCVRTFGSE